MSDESPAPNQLHKPTDSRPEIQGPEPVDSPGTTQPSPSSELQAVKKELSGYERATLRWTIVIVVVNALTCLFIFLQWREMNSGSVDTHTLAQAAKIQAVAAQGSAETAKNAAHDTLAEMQKQSRAMQDAAQAAIASAVAAKSAANTAQSSLVSVQRAFISFSHFQYERYTEPDRSHLWMITPQIENTGTTPALPTGNFTSIDRLTTEPDESRFRGSQTRFATIPIGPKAEWGLDPLLKQESFLFGKDLGDVIQLPPFPRDTTLYAWGWVTYMDIFHMPHVTEFCTKLSNIGLLDNSRQVQWIWGTCLQHNCIDEYCPDSKSIEALVPVPTR